MIKRYTFNFFSLLMFAALAVYVAACSSNDINEPVDCTTSDLAIKASTQANPTGCSTQDGSISVEGSGGKSPYQFAVNTGSYGTSSTFTSLGAGTHTLKVKDGNECERSIQVTLTAPGSTLAATLDNTADSECLTDNGKIVINATGGTSPYQYKIGSGAFGTTSTFTGLKEGSYAIVVKDDIGCTVTINSSVAHGTTGVSFASQIDPILKANCTSANCHGTGSANGDWTKFSAVSAKATLIKNRTTDKSMPQGGSLTADQIALIACWVNDGALNN